MNESQLESKKKKWEFGIKAVCMLILGFVVAPFIYVAIQGLIGLALAAGICIGINFFVPVFADKLSNWRIKLIKAEAAKNPIETLQRDYGQKEEALNSFKESISRFKAATLNFKDKLDGFKDKFPNDTAKFDEILSNMKKLLAIRIVKYQDAEGQLEKYSSEIERAKAIWDMGQEAAKMNAAAGMSQGDFMQKIKVETALDSVTTSMNMAFADLETSLLVDKGEKEMLKLGEAVSSKVPEVKDAQFIEVKARKK